MVYYGTPADKIEVIYNAIDTGELQPDSNARRRLEEEFAIRSSEFVVVFMASLVGWKRPELAIRACN